MTSEQKTMIAIDIDDVVANTIDSVRVWANELTGATLEHGHYHTDDEYWNYYNSIWERHGLADQITFETFLELMETDQSRVLLNDDAHDVIAALKKKYDLVFITSRPLAQKEETRRWLDKHIDSKIPLYISANPAVQQNIQSKGEICAELGVSLLIDDNINNCKSAVEYGADAILFGEYGWNKNMPEGITRCLSWREVAERLLNE